MTRKLLITLLLISAITASVSLGILAAPSLKLIVNGKSSSLEIKVINNVNYVPLNQFAALLGQDVKLDTKTNTVTVSTKKAALKATASPSPAPKTAGSSRSNAASVDSIVKFKLTEATNEFTGGLSVDNIVWGEDAAKLIKEASSLNKPAKEGFQYLLAKITIKINTSKNKNSAAKITLSQFTLVSSEGLITLIAPLLCRIHLSPQLFMQMTKKPVGSRSRLRKRISML